MSGRNHGFTLIELLIVIGIIALTTVALFPMIMSMKQSIDLTNTGQALLGELSTMQSTAFSGKQSHGSGITEVYVVHVDKTHNVILGFATPVVVAQTAVEQRTFHVSPNKHGPWLVTETIGGTPVLQYPVTPVRIPEPLEIISMNDHTGKEFDSLLMYVLPFERRIRMIGDSAEKITVTVGFGKRVRRIVIDLVNGRAQLHQGTQ